MSAQGTNVTSASEGSSGRNQSISQFQNKSDMQSITTSDNKSMYNSAKADARKNANLSSLEDRTMLNVPLHNSKVTGTPKNSPKSTNVETGSMSIKVAEQEFHKLAELAFNDELERIFFND